MADTPRLPHPGGDNGDWGDLLNQFLLVSHNDDGTIKAGAAVDADNKQIVNVGNPVNDQDAATKSYVDNNSGGSLVLPAADQALVSIDTSTYDNILTGEGKYSTAVFSSETAALSVAQNGDDYPRFVLDSVGGLYLSDGSMDPISNGASIWTSGSKDSQPEADLSLSGGGASLTLGRDDPADSTNPLVVFWNDLWLSTGDNFSHGAAIRVRLGNPNGNTAGNAGDFLIDNDTPALWQCTASGDAADAVWTQVGSGDGSGLPSGWTKDDTVGQIVTYSPNDNDGVYNTITFVRPADYDSWNAFQALDSEGNYLGGFDGVNFLSATADQAYAGLSATNGIFISPTNDTTVFSVDTAGAFQLGIGTGDLHSMLRFQRFEEDPTLYIQGSAEQISDLLSINSRTGGSTVSEVFSIDSIGAVAITPINGDEVTLTVVGSAADGTSHLQEWQTFDGTAVAWIAADGTPGGTLANGFGGGGGSDGTVPDWLEFEDNDPVSDPDPDPDDTGDTRMLGIPSTDGSAFVALGTQDNTNAGGASGILTLINGFEGDGPQTLVQLDALPDGSNNFAEVPRVANLTIFQEPGAEFPYILLFTDFANPDFVVLPGGTMTMAPSADTGAGSGLWINMKYDMPGLAITASSSQSTNLQEWQDNNGTAQAWIDASGNPGGTLAGVQGLPSWFTLSDEVATVQDANTTAAAKLSVIQGNDLVAGVLELVSEDDGEDNYLIRLDSHPDYTNDDYGNSRDTYFTIVREGEGAPNTMHVEGDNGDEMFIYNGGAMKLLPNQGGYGAGLEISMAVDMPGIRIGASQDQTENLQEWRDGDGNNLAWIAADGTPGGTLGSVGGGAITDLTVVNGSSATVFEANDGGVVITPTDGSGNPLVVENALGMTILGVTGNGPATEVNMGVGATVFTVSNDADTPTLGFFGTVAGGGQQSASDGSSLITALQNYGLLSSGSSWTDGGTSTPSVIAFYGEMQLIATDGEVDYFVDDVIPSDPSATYGNFTKYWTSLALTYNMGTVCTTPDFSVSLVDTTYHTYDLEVTIRITSPDRSNRMTLTGIANAVSGSPGDTATVDHTQYTASNTAGSDLSYNASFGSVESSSGGTYIIEVEVHGHWDNPGGNSGS